MVTGVISVSIYLSMYSGKIAQPVASLHLYLGSCSPSGD